MKLDPASNITLETMAKYWPPPRAPWSRAIFEDVRKKGAGNAGGRRGSVVSSMQYLYFVNKITGEAQWDDPGIILDDDEEVDEPMAEGEVCWREKQEQVQEKENGGRQEDEIAEVGEVTEDSPQNEEGLR